MSGEIVKEFVAQRNNFTGTDYLLHTVAFHVAPIIEGAKPGVILTFKNCKRNLCALWAEYKKTFPRTSKLSFFEVKAEASQIIVFFYDEYLLNKVISTPGNKKLLKRYGYREELTLEEVLCHLQGRFGEEFPHEIGVFLGIPLKDTISFIRHKGQNFITNGYWKVYHNPEQAYVTFEMFEKARRQFISFISKGRKPLDYLLEKVA